MPQVKKGINSCCCLLCKAAIGSRSEGEKLLYKGLQCIGVDYGRCVLKGWVARVGNLTQGVI